MLTSVLLATGMLALAVPAPVAQAADFPDSLVDGGFIISDREFYDGKSMTVAEIQAFLDEQVPQCAAGGSCLKDFVQSHPDKEADKFCAAIAGGTEESAARIIYKVAVACSINPKVLLVMLQKEQSLVTLTNPSQSRFDRAMGYACPDSGPNNSANCNELHYGFTNQVYRAARQMQVYTLEPWYFAYGPGRVNTIKWNPDPLCGTSKVYIQNQATANLYSYTPYRANIAALSAGWGTGDPCSSYGNRNFYNYYLEWFEPDQANSAGAPAQIAVCALPPASEISRRNVSATVSMELLYARQAPSVLCQQDLITLRLGEDVTITGKYGAWSRIKTGDMQAWVLADYLDTSATPDPAPAPDGEVRWVEPTTSLNLRGTPSLFSQVLTVIPPGMVVPVSETRGIWHRVTINRFSGWVHGDYVNVVTRDATEHQTVVTTAKLNLRRYTSMSAQIFAVIPAQTTLIVTSTSGPWHQVTYGDHIGWIHSDWVN
jgi:SH3-like domain-containing protein